MQVRPGALIVLAVLLCATPALAADVQYVKTLIKAPGEGFFVNSAVPLQDALWTGKYFVVRSGFCSGQTPGMNGTYVFAEDGTFVGKRDQAWDEGNFDCWQHTWSVGSARTERVDDSSFIAEAGDLSRSPVYYAVRNGKLEMVSRANPNPPYTSCSGCEPSAREVGIGPALAVTQNGYVVGREQGRTGGSVNIYKLPSWQVVGTMPDTSVIGAIGNYVLGWGRDASSGTTSGFVYRVSDAGQATFVKKIPALSDFEADQWNPNRGLLFGVVKDGTTVKHVWKIYDATATDLVEESTRELPVSIDPLMNADLSPRPIGLAGGYIGVIAYRPAANGGTQALWESRPIEIWKGDQHLTLQAPPNMPPSRSGLPEEPSEQGTGIAISQTGKVVVTNNHGAHLYQIVNFNASASSSPVCGNGVDEGSEQCDAGAQNGACPRGCSASCTINTCVQTGGSNGSDNSTAAAAGYAPATDPVTGQTYLRASAVQTGQTASVTVTAGSQGKYIYKIGAYLDASGAWAQFTFPQQTQNDWIQDQATATIPNAPASGAVIVYACEKYSSAWVCGPTSPVPDPSVKLWTVAQYTTGADLPPLPRMP